MGAELSTDGGGGSAGGAPKPDLANFDGSAPDRPRLTTPTQEHRTRSSRTVGSGGGGERGDDVSVVSKRHVLVGAKMGMETDTPVTTPTPVMVTSRASSALPAALKVTTIASASSARSFPPKRGHAKIASPSALTHKERAVSDVSAMVGSTEEMYSVSSIIQDEKLANGSAEDTGTKTVKSRATTTANSKTIAVPTTSTSPALNAAQARRQRHGDLPATSRVAKGSTPTEETGGSGSGVSLMGSEMEFQPSDVGAFFDKTENSTTPSSSAKMNGTNEMVDAGGRGVTSNSLVPKQAPTAPTVRRSTAAASTSRTLQSTASSLLKDSDADNHDAVSLDRHRHGTSSGHLRSSSSQMERESSLYSASGLPSRGSLLSSREEGLSRHSSMRSNNSTHSKSSASGKGKTGKKTTPSTTTTTTTIGAHGAVRLTSRDLNVKPVRRGQSASSEKNETNAAPTRMTATGSSARTTTTATVTSRAHKDQRTPIPATAAASARVRSSPPTNVGSSSLTNIDRSGTTTASPGSQRNTNPPSGTSPRSGGAQAAGMGSFFAMKRPSDSNGFYGTAVGITSLYRDGDDVDAESQNSAANTASARGSHTATSLYRAEQPLLFSSNASCRDSSSFGSTLEGELLGAHSHGSVNASFFAMRDQTYTSSGPSSQANSRANRSAVAGAADSPRSPKARTGGPTSFGNGSMKEHPAGDLPTAASTSSLLRANVRNSNTSSAHTAEKHPADTKGHTASNCEDEVTGPYDLGSLTDIPLGQPRRTNSNASSRTGSRGSHRSLTESVASSLQSSRSSSVSSTVSRRDVNGLQRRAAARSSRSPGTSVFGNFQGRYVNAGVRKRGGGVGASDDVLHSPGESAQSDVNTSHAMTREASGSGQLRNASSGRRRRGTLTTFADADEENTNSGGGGINGDSRQHDGFNAFFTRTASQNGIEVGGSSPTHRRSRGNDEEDDDSISEGRRQAKADILVQLSNNSSAGSNHSQSGSAQGTPFRHTRPPATSFKPLTISADKLKAYQQTYGIGEI